MKKKEKHSRTIQHLVINCLMFVYFAWICICIYTYTYIYAYDALSKGHSMYARAKGNHHIIHPILASIRTRLFLSSLFFLYVVLSHYRCRFSNKRMHFFFSSIYIYIYTYIHTYIRCVQTASFEQNKNLSLVFFLFHILAIEKKK
jgi:hypothetical protein